MPPQQPVALKERSPASTAARVAAALNVEARHVPGARNGWRHRHQLFGCGDRWIAAGQLPAGYIIPLMSGMPPPWAPSFSGGSATIASVVRMFLAIDAAF